MAPGLLLSCEGVFKKADRLFCLACLATGEVTSLLREGFEMIEIRWHARGGQGAVTAAKAVAEAALLEGRYVQASPEYGPERAGAPIRAYNRLSDAPIRIYGPITAPQVVVVLDPTLTGSEDILEGTSEGALVLVNSPLPPERLRDRLKVQGRKLYTLDATRIALEEIGRPFPNTPMLGALAKVTKGFSLSGVLKQLEESLGKKLPRRVVEGNLKAVMRGHDEVKGEHHG